MPLLDEIFGTRDANGRMIRDAKRAKCTHIKDIDDLPFVKRCKHPKALGLSVCLHHAKTVTYMPDVTKPAITRYFSTIDEAEYFRKYEASLSWIESNYAIPKALKK